ncbi:MAG TPA: low-specificity L-threonine aldolase [Aggregatilineales bacterium]|nr:low-specificity L-threonine aldolase [Chloroflexota bacterium]HOA23263.1 low-specificity L-threonine aldolase [Aggregatilineales bacterium]HPV07545.1 low-specificity L-threonine aldolase [Aggregatilineales bacterium]HQA68430.1 low-specificity L-threonine aldolase [Aggregatilineales bacterium]
MDAIDLRSDTVTWPTPEMREAMAHAEVGDDVWGDDPTVKRLEALAAERMGQEAGLFVASGTMGNLIAILTHCRPGDEMIVGKAAHTFKYEVGGAAALGGVHPYTIPVQADGTLDLDDIRHAIRDRSDIHYPLTRLVELENTQGTVGGIPLTPEYTRAVRALCDEHGLLLHIDGARIWNAAVALGVDVSELAGPADSITFCLSKGLCAPVGSVLCGPAEFIDRARRTRKMLGGGMRQAGILAAAGIIAIEKMTGRLHEDHANARRLAEGLSQIDGVLVDVERVCTNMVFFSLDESVPFDARTLAARLEAEHNIKLDVTGERNFRAVTHYWITPERVEVTLQAIREAL